MRLPPLDPSTIRVTPAEAAASFKDPPRRRRISMHGNRPVYRFNTGRVFGRWTLIYKAERLDRTNRWGYYGLHGLDFAFLYRYRPLWDIVAIALLVGVGASSVTSIVPAFRRLARHARGLLAKQRHDILPGFLVGNRRRRVAELVLDVDMRRRARAQQQTDRLETGTAPDRHM
jgi:hypothetical protein